MYNGDTPLRHILGSHLLFNNNFTQSMLPPYAPKITASNDGHTEIVKLLLNNKADPNICSDGESPLHAASLHGHTEIVELLLNNISV
jgi:ankyrin repeat protein